MPAFLASTSDTGVLSVLLCAAAFGVLVAFLTTRRLRRSVDDFTALSVARTARTLGTDLVAGVDAMTAWRMSIEAVSGDLARLDVRLVPSGRSDLPVVARRPVEFDGTGQDASSVVVPRTGAVIRMSDPRLTHEMLVSPRAGFGSVEVSRSVLLGFADQLESTVRSGMVRAEDGTVGTLGA